MKTESYAQALITAAYKDGADAKVLVQRLADYLKAQGRLKLLPQILRDIEKISARDAKLAPRVEVAHEKDAPAALAEAAAHGIHASKAHVNHDLISGWRATSNGKLVDRSGKRALVDLYRKVTTHA